MSFKDEGLAFNLLDTRVTRISAQWDFSEDTYRTLTAVGPRRDHRPRSCAKLVR
jgi:peptide subunit release factor RF-3